MSMNIANVPLPNLPGFKAYRPGKGQKTKAFTFVNGQIFMKDESLPPVEKGAAESQSVTSIGAANSSILMKKKSQKSENINMTLTFQCYFEEEYEKGEQMELRVRKCNMYYFLENNTMAIVEKPQLNSGIPQGTLVRRGVVHKPDGTAYTPDDFRLGSEIAVYGRHYKIVDCDNATRKYLRRNMQVNESSSLDVPVDDYDQFRKTIQPDLSDETWGRFNCKKNEGTKYQQAKMGCNPDSNNGREGFIRYGDKTVQFKCVWDNTGTMYGDRINFSLVYHLCDDTVEIFSLPSKNGPKEQFSRLLKRSQLPLFFGGLRDLQAARDQDKYFHWTDFYIGLEMDVYARTLRIVDADRSTRRFYEENGLNLEPPESEPTAKVVIHEREIPPPTAFGSEEDSLRSCFGSLMPGPPPAKKYGENKNLNFFALLLSGGLDDVNRRFVITYYVSDNTVKVQEPPIRNSGFNGGLFLSRREVTMPDGHKMGPRDMFIGCHLSLLKHKFLLLDANDATLRWQEDQFYPFASFYDVLDKTRTAVIDDIHSGAFNEQIQSYEKSPEESGMFTKETLKAVFDSYGLFGNESHQVPEHGLITIMRGGGNKEPYFSTAKLIEQYLRPTDEFK
jgi:EF-hand domain-containing protein 1